MKKNISSIWGEKSFVIIIRLCFALIAIVSFFFGIFTKNIKAVKGGSIFFLLIIAVPVVSKVLKIQFPYGLDLLMLLFFFFAEFLGEVFSLYIHIKAYDIILHFTSGIICASFALGMIKLLSKDKDILEKISPFLTFIILISFTALIGFLWECVEYSGDQILGLNSQRDRVVNEIHTVELDQTKTNHVVFIDDIVDTIIVHSDGSKESLGLGGYLERGITDTMKDMTMNTLGAILYSIFVLIYLKNKGNKARFVSAFTPYSLSS